MTDPCSLEKVGENERLGASSLREDRAGAPFGGQAPSGLEQSRSSHGAEPRYTWVALAKDCVKGPPWNYYILDPDGREMALCQMADGESHAEQIVDALNREDDKFNLRWNADMRAIKRWQEATGRHLTWPDHADLVVWLLEQLESASGIEAPSGGETGTGSTEGESPVGDSRDAQPEVSHD